jgi:hypothetical protein
MTNYSVTIGYRAVIEVNVKAESEEDARVLALKELEKMRGRIASRNLNLNDDYYKTAGVLNMDESWNMVQS